MKDGLCHWALWHHMDSGARRAPLPVVADEAIFIVGETASGNLTKFPTVN